MRRVSIRAHQWLIHKKGWGKRTVFQELFECKMLTANVLAGREAFFFEKKQKAASLRRAMPL